MARRTVGTRSVGLVVMLVAIGVSACDEAAESAPDVSADGAGDVTPDVSSEVSPDTSAPDTSPLDTGLPDTTPDVVTPPLNPIGDELKVAIEPITVLSGEERQVCRTINVPGNVPLDIVRFESKMRGLSHHFNLYKVIDGTRLDPVTAAETATSDCQPAAEQLRGDAAYIYGSASPDRVMETPAGVAFRLESGQRLILEFHAINYTLDPIEADVEISLFAAAPEANIEHHADIMWFANWGFALPPGQETSSTKSCSVPYDVEIFGLMSHFHELGTQFEVSAITADGSTKVYEDDDWQHPKYEPFMPTLSLAAGESLSWTCTWDNTRNDWVLPNKGSKDEMCMVFAAAYPKNTLSAEPIQCNVTF